VLAPFLVEELAFAALDSPAQFALVSLVFGQPHP
jgi:hypothetical protein